MPGLESKPPFPKHRSPLKRSASGSVLANARVAELEKGTLNPVFESAWPQRQEHGLRAQGLRSG